MKEVPGDVSLPARLVNKSAHSHITGLGLDGSARASQNKDGFIGQKNAREAAGIIVELTKNRKMAGKAVLFAGPSGTGKTALAHAIAAELGKEIPFCSVSGSQIYSAEVKKTEILTEQIRRAIGVRIRQTGTIYEGEVCSLVFNGAPDAFTDGGKKITEIQLEMKSQKGKKSLRLDPSMYEAFAKQKIQVGDMIAVEGSTGIVKRLGRSETHSNEHDVEAEVYLPLPRGDVKKTKETVHTITLHDLDAAQASPTDGSDALSLLNKIKKPKKTEITQTLREKVNLMVDEMVHKGTAEIQPGLLFVDELHMLDKDCFAFLNRALELPTTPIIAMATNRIENRAGEENLPLGLPRDLLDRLLIVQTEAYDRKEMKEIVAVRAQMARVVLDEEAVACVVDLSAERSLRYAVNLLLPARKLSSVRGAAVVGRTDIENASRLFSGVCRA